MLLLLFTELETNSGLLIHGLGRVLLTGRALHACGVSRVAEDHRFRVSGMALTFTALISCALAILWAYAPGT